MTDRSQVSSPQVMRLTEVAADERVVVPQIVASHSSRRVLTMQLLPAVRIDDREGLARLGARPRENMLREVLVRWLYEQISERIQADGTVKRFMGPEPETDTGNGEASVWRTMDCVDCHNRPTHIFLTPEQALDEFFTVVSEVTFRP